MSAQDEGGVVVAGDSMIWYDETRSLCAKRPRVGNGCVDGNGPYDPADDPHPKGFPETCLRAEMICRILRSEGSAIVDECHSSSQTHLSPSRLSYPQGFVSPGET